MENLTSIPDSSTQKTMINLTPEINHTAGACALDTSKIVGVAYYRFFIDRWTPMKSRINRGFFSKKQFLVG